MGERVETQMYFILNNNLLVFQNPDRANLRTMALALGAKYKMDWDNSCTHLICAYKNTPKYTQVRKLGKIVKRHWVEKCHKLRKRLPWRRYALDDREAGKPESDDEIHDESMMPRSSAESPKQDRTLSLYDKEEISHNTNVISSGEDTEDELDRVRSKHNPIDVSVVLSDDDSQEMKMTSRRKESSPNQSVVISTDEEEGIADDGEFPVNKKGIFSGKKIFLSTILGTEDREKLSRLLGEHKAIISDKDSNSNVIVSNRNEKKVIKDYVTPQWVYESCIMNCALPTELYLA